MTGHDMDPLTEYCRRCGKPAEMIVDYRFECYGGGNVIAISHIIARRRLKDLVEHIDDRLYREWMMPPK